MNLELLRIENIFMSRKIENKTILSMTKKGLFSLRHKIDYHPRRERFSAKTDWWCYSTLTDFYMNTAEN